MIPSSVLLSEGLAVEWKPLDLPEMLKVYSTPNSSVPAKSNPKV
jgi:hypothetical protein